MTNEPIPRREPPISDAESVARARVGQALRDLGHAFVARRASVDKLTELAERLEAAKDFLCLQPTRNQTYTKLALWTELVDYPQGRFEHAFEDRPVSGKASPLGLDLEFHRHGDEIEAFVTFREAHEGAFGRSHGGLVAALFDDVFGYVLGAIRQGAFTGELTVRYVSATPLHSRLSCRVGLTEKDGRKLYMAGQLTEVSSGEVVATAKATFIAVPPEVFDWLTDQRPAPPDEDAPVDPAGSTR